MDANKFFKMYQRRHKPDLPARPPDRSDTFGVGPRELDVNGSSHLEDSRRHDHLRTSWRLSAEGRRLPKGLGGGEGTLPEES